MTIIGAIEKERICERNFFLNIFDVNHITQNNLTLKGFKTFY